MSWTQLTVPPHWLTQLLNNPHITDICIHGTESGAGNHLKTIQVFMDQGNGMESVSVPEDSFWPEENMRQWILDQLSAAGRTWDARFPFIDAKLSTGHRLHVAFPPLAQQGMILSFRRLASGQNQFIQDPTFPNRWARSPHYEFLRQAVLAGDSVLIAGATGSGKTTLASDLLSSVPPSERIIALEDTPELSPQHPHFLSLVSRPPNADGFGEVTLRTLLKQVLRMRPDRIILGECRGSEVLELLQALNTGHRGSLATLHANSPRDALRRVELLCLLAAGGSIPLFAIRELISVGVQWVAHVKKNGSERVISEIWRVEGREGDTILMRPMLKDGNGP